MGTAIMIGMSENTWTWMLVGFELIAISGLWLVGARKWWGWALVLASSLPWFAYSVVFDKPGFTAMSLIYITTHISNLYRWRRMDRAGQPPATAGMIDTVSPDGTLVLSPSR